MSVIKGLETITEPAFTIAQSNSVGYNCMLFGQAVQSIWNKKGIAFIPYCITCKCPLDWHRDEQVLFSCPKCKRIWQKDVGWDLEGLDEGQLRSRV